MVAEITIPGMFLSGDHASRPAANAVGKGSLYACSTHKLVYQSDGSTWGTWLDASAGTPSDPAWTTYTPTWTAPSVNPSLGNGLFMAAYLITGKSLKFRIHLTMGTTTTYGTGRWDFGLPAGVSTLGLGSQLVAGFAIDNSIIRTDVLAAWIPASATPVVRPAATQATGSIIGISSAVPFTWASTDQLFVQGVIEIA